MRDPSLDINALGNISVDLCVALGEARAQISEILSYHPGTVIVLNCKADAPVRLLINGTAVANGQIVEADDGNLAIEICEMIRGIVPAVAG